MYNKHLELLRPTIIFSYNNLQYSVIISSRAKRMLFFLLMVYVTESQGQRIFPF